MKHLYDGDERLLLS